MTFAEETLSNLFITELKGDFGTISGESAGGPVIFDSVRSLPGPGFDPWSGS